MIIARIILGAGMGNQMFMYAAGLSVASKHNTELRLGAWDFEALTRKDRPWQLDCFPNITERNASLSETWRMCHQQAILNVVTGKKPMKKYHVFRRLIRKILRVSFPLETAKSVFFDTPENYSSARFGGISDNTYMIGYFESERFFAGIKDTVRKKFRFSDECFNKSLAEQIRSRNSVAVHVRRGDKVGKNPSTESYIKKSLERVSELTENPEFFVFSDDMKYCKETLPKIYDARYHFIEGQTPPQDMALMTICRHVIVAPSTFSWWGAWLNENPDKIVIAPDLNIWYRQVTDYRKYLLPESWIKIG